MVVLDTLKTMYSGKFAGKSILQRAPPVMFFQCSSYAQSKEEEEEEEEPVNMKYSCNHILWSLQSFGDMF